jgi:hypothetical protein
VNRGDGERTSSIRAVLRRSVGVTARRDSMAQAAPAALSARMPRGVERWPWGSERADLMAPKVRKRMEALNAAPLGRV